jgi:hypothetical protein
MPTTFQDREQAFEAKFAHDEEFRFLALARRDKLFARWAAATLDMSAEETEALVTTVLAISNRRGHDEALLRHIADLMSEHGFAPDPTLPQVLERCMQDARAQLVAKRPGDSVPL